MRTTALRTRCYLHIAVLAAWVLASGAAFAGDEGHKPITRQLMNLVESNPEVRGMLETSIAEARKVNPDPRTNPAQNLSDYYDFIDRASELIPQDVLEFLHADVDAWEAMHNIAHYKSPEGE